MEAPFDPHSAALELFGSDCAACVAQECGHEVDACEFDEACAAEVVCQHACAPDAPPCHEACVADYALGHEPSFALAACAASACAARCSALGRDYGCTGGYRWPRPDAVVSKLMLQLGQFTATGGADTLAEEGVRVRVCPSREEPSCLKPLREFSSTEAGEVDLVLDNHGGDNKGYTPFDGFLAFDDDAGRASPRIVPTLLLFDRSWPAPDRRIDTLLVTPTSPFPMDAATGLVAGVAFDCRALNPVRGVGLTIEVGGEPATFYDNGSATGQAGFFARTAVTPGDTEVRALDGDRVIASMTVPVVSGTVTYLWLWPSAQAE